MSESTEVIHVDASTRLTDILDDLGLRRIILEYDGMRYELVAKPLNVVRDGNEWGDYDPEKVREALRKYAGTLSDEKAKAMKEYIYQGRIDEVDTLDAQ